MLAQGCYHAAHAIIEESQPVKNRDLSRIISNLSLQKVTATVFIVFQRCLLFSKSKNYHVMFGFHVESSNAFLTYTGLQTGQQQNLTRRDHHLLE